MSHTSKSGLSIGELLRWTALLIWKIFVFITWAGLRAIELVAGMLQELFKKLLKDES